MKIALIGLGEVGAILGEDLSVGCFALSAWDIQFANRTSLPTHAAQQLGLQVAQTPITAVAGAELIISAVTAGQTVAAAASVASGLAENAWYLDLNSASPSTKREAASVINQAGGRYVEAAVMSPFSPKRCATPMLLGGPHAEGFVMVAHDIGLSSVSFFADEYGKAAAAKLCRSVIVKGFEALLLEALAAARHYEVEDVVIDSLGDLFPNIEWRPQARYFISRAIQHGARRAQEMGHAANMVADAGLAAFMSGASAGRQAEAAKFVNALKAPSLEEMLDAILMRVNGPTERNHP